MKRIELGRRTRRAAFATVATLGLAEAGLFFIGPGTGLLTPSPYEIKGQPNAMD
jgi:hypothetical protein